MSTLDSLLTQVYAVLRDERREFITEPMVVLWLNEAQRDLGSRIHELVTASVSGTVGEDAATFYDVDGTTDLAIGTILVPADLVMVRVLQLGGETVRFVDDEVFNSYAEIEGSSALSTIARIFGRQTYATGTPPVVLTGYERFIEFSSDVDGSAYVMRYTRLPVDLDSPEDVVEVPEYLETKMVNYARAHAKWQQGEQRQGDNYYALYSENLPEPPRGQILTRPGPITLSYEGNAFDHQLDASHRG